jgi:glycosyltransferase involved in cell wall biosynthesis
MDEVASKPRCIIATRDIGVFSQPWLYRQIVGFQSLQPHVLTWNYHNRDSFQLNGISVKVLSHDPDPFEQPGVGRWFYRLRNAKDLNFYGSVGSERKDIASWLGEIQPDVILCHFGFMGLRMLPVAKELGIPVVVHFHGLDLSSSLRNRWYCRSLLRALNRFSAMVVVGSHQGAWIRRQQVTENRVHLIPCGVPAGEFPPRSHAQKEGIQFLSVSRLDEGKGVEYSLEAFSSLRKDYPKAKYLIVGDGPLKGDLEKRVISLELTESVKFTGAVMQEEVKKYFQNSDVFLQHSIDSSRGWVEGFGVSISEAAASGLPVIATYSGGIPDQVIDGETGFLVNQKDVPAMTDRMRQLMTDAELRRTMGEAGRNRVQEHFDTPGQIQKLENVLLAAAGKG